MCFLQLNQGQSSGPAGVDINVAPVWKAGVTGRGVVVSILDDGESQLSTSVKDWPSEI